MICCGMRREAHHNAWVAAFLAIVLKVMALPMATAFGSLSLEQLLAGSFCSSGGLQQSALVLDKDSSGSPDAGGTSHCCCSQSVGAAPLPPSPLAAPGRLAALRPTPAAHPFAVSPRERWPSINPRASPVLPGCP
ncbi:hypothetical protein PSm6_55910 [Pseudomonas solani]|uniref:DUF2946 family protein n=1 Tax=Pseudomonas solani TaxID=2731552 RepID=A0AAU7YA37_9PSED|nr:MULTISPECIES: DUF2946 family protein [Pseudomonas]WCD77953.1 DUF2946 family protein [Pseudomonas sp. TUM22785]BCD89184.1 hypothetical protein PSm6_55910 [Pseudomonas solani]